jgi:hypothetical protein
MAIRIYVVTDNETQKQRLIRAANRAEAVRFASRTRFSVEAASQDDLVNLLPNGVKIEVSKVDLDTKSLIEDEAAKAE